MFALLEGSDWFITLQRITADNIFFNLKVNSLVLEFSAPIPPPSPSLLQSDGDTFPILCHRKTEGHFDPEQGHFLRGGRERGQDAISASLPEGALF